MKKPELRLSFFQYIFFNILSSLGVSVYILVDTYFISKGMGADGLAALNLCLPIFNFLNGFGLMLGVGGGSRFSMFYCRVERRETDKIYTNAFYAAVAVSLVFVMLGVFCSGAVTRILGADDHLFEMAHSYLKTVFLFAPAFILNQLLLCFMRNDAAPRLAMVAVLASSAANLVLDYHFIFRMDMGMQGAALATCISPIISMAVMSVHFLSGWNAFRFRPTKPSHEELKSISSLGLSSLVTEISGGVVIFAFNFVVYRMIGNTGIAAYGIIANLAIVFTAIFTGLSAGVQPLMCRLHGEKDGDSVKYLFRLSVITATLLAGAAYALVWWYTTPLVGIFAEEGNAELQAIAEKGLRLYFLYMPVMGLNTVFSVYFTSIEVPLPSQLISLMRGTLLVIPLLSLFDLLHAEIGVWLAVPTAELITAIVGGVIYYYVAKPYEVYVYQYVPNRNRQPVGEETSGQET